MSFFKTTINIGADSGFLAVEADFYSDHEFILRILEIKQKKSKIDFTVIYNDKADAEKFGKLIHGKSIVLLITGKGILTKKITSKTDHVQPEDILPNSGKDDFYWQQFPLETHSFASICRKQKVDELLRICKAQNAIVGEVYLGNGVLQFAGSLFQKSELLLPKAHLVFENGILQEIKPGQQEEILFKLEEKEIPSSLILLLCGALFFASKGELYSSIQSDEYMYFQGEWKQKNRFQKTGALVLISFLLVLFGNYLAYNHYSQRYELLQEEVAYKQSELDLLNTLNQELQEKQNLIGGTGLNNGYPVSILADKIGVTVPSTVQLTEMNIQPLESGKLKKENKATFKNNLIVIKGKIYKSTDINQWIKTIKNEKLVRDVLVTHYNQSLNENYAEFELNINLN